MLFYCVYSYTNKYLTESSAFLTHTLSFLLSLYRCKIYTYIYHNIQTKYKKTRRKREKKKKSELSIYKIPWRIYLVCFFTYTSRRRHCLKKTFLFLSTFLKRVHSQFIHILTICASGTTLCSSQSLLCLYPWCPMQSLFLLLPLVNLNRVEVLYKEKLSSSPKVLSDPK